MDHNKIKSKETIIDTILNGQATRYIKNTKLKALLQQQQQQQQIQQQLQLQQHQQFNMSQNITKSPPILLNDYSMQSMLKRRLDLLSQTAQLRSKHDCQFIAGSCPVTSEQSMLQMKATEASTKLENWKSPDRFQEASALATSQPRQCRKRLVVASLRPMSSLLATHHDSAFSRYIGQLERRIKESEPMTSLSSMGPSKETLLESNSDMASVISSLKSSSRLNVSNIKGSRRVTHSRAPKKGNLVVQRQQPKKVGKKRWGKASKIKATNSTTITGQAEKDSLTIQSRSLLSLLEKAYQLYKSRQSADFEASVSLKMKNGTMSSSKSSIGKDDYTVKGEARKMPSPPSAASIRSEVEKSNKERWAAIRKMDRLNYRKTKPAEMKGFPRGKTATVVKEVFSPKDAKVEDNLNQTFLRSSYSASDLTQHHIQQWYLWVDALRDQLLERCRQMQIPMKRSLLDAALGLSPERWYRPFIPGPDYTMVCTLKLPPDTKNSWLKRVQRNNEQRRWARGLDKLWHGNDRNLERMRPFYAKGVFSFQKEDSSIELDNVITMPQSEPNCNSLPAPSTFKPSSTSSTISPLTTSSKELISLSSPEQASSLSSIPLTGSPKIQRKTKNKKKAAKKPPVVMNFTQDFTLITPRVHSYWLKSEVKELKNKKILRQNIKSNGRIATSKQFSDSALPPLPHPTTAKAIGEKREFCEVLKLPSLKVKATPFRSRHQSSSTWLDTAFINTKFKPLRSENNIATDHWINDPRKY